MIIRFIAKNVFSFKEETEFNLLPNKTQKLPHHKVQTSYFEFLRFSAIYGANGSGKSNLVNSISLLESMVESGKLPNGVQDIKFKLDEASLFEPISLGIEFYSNLKVFYYSITFDGNQIIHEYFAESRKSQDTLIFERSIIDGIQNVKFYPEYYKDDKNKLFVEILSEKLIQKNELLLTFLSDKYSDEFPDTKTAFNWFDSTLVIIKPDAKPGGIAHILDSNFKTKEFANKLIPSLNTGVSKIEIEKKKFDEFVGSENSKKIKRLKDDIKNKPESLSFLLHTETGEEASLVYEDDEVMVKRLITTHINNKGINIDFTIGQESDGTRRLIDYIPALDGIINDDKVFIIDEIERSIHPITIKEIISKISLDTNAKGQLIFTTHESNLLDQEILRPDEIWFAQKDFDGSSKLYSLSEFKIHNTIDIENGYLNGRYGGIPFLSNLKDLNWQ